MNTQIFDSLDWQDEDELHKVFNYSTRAIFSFFLKKNIQNNISMNCPCIATNQ